jgi:ribosomal protein S10
MVTETSKKTESVPKLRIKLKAYDHKIIDKSAQQIIDVAIMIELVKLIFLPV